MARGERHRSARRPAGQRRTIAPCGLRPSPGSCLEHVTSSRAQRTHPSGRRRGRCRRFCLPRGAATPAHLLLARHRRLAGAT
jgi:hypothetical protein